MDSAEAKEGPTGSTLNILGMDGAEPQSGGFGKAQTETLNSMLKRASESDKHSGENNVLYEQLQDIQKSTRLEGSDRYKTSVPTQALDLAIGMPGVIASTGLAFASSALGLSLLSTSHGRDAIDSAQTAAEAAKIKEQFQGTLGASAIKEIEGKCVPSTRDKVLSYGYNIAEQGAIGLISGAQTAPVTGGWSLPVLTLAGVGNGALHARTDLSMQQSNCEVKEMREKLLKW